MNSLSKSDQEVFFRMYGKEIVGGVETGKKTKTTPEECGKSVSEKSRTTCALEKPL